MLFAQQARVTLLPLIEQILEILGDVDQRGGSAPDRPGSAAGSNPDDLPIVAFFTGILHRAHAMQAEEDVLDLFFELSNTAFLGFQFSPALARVVDDLLAAAERIAFTMTAPDQEPH